MTSKEALERLKFIGDKELNTGSKSYDDLQELWDYKEPLKVIEKLVERDIPIKVKHKNNGIPYCAVCERSYLRDVRGNQNRFCGYCGQRLDWNDEDEN